MDHKGDPFPRDSRLTRPYEYRQVFADSCRVSSRGFTLLSTSNNLSRARLGLAISKKCAPLAVSRNQIKRLIRESFRHHQAGLPALDIVVLCRPPVLEQSNSEILGDLNQLWKRLAKKCPAS